MTENTKEIAKKEKAAKSADSARKTPKASDWTYKQWYEKNKEVLAQRRALKYHENKKHREKVLARNKEYRARVAKEQPYKPKERPKALRNRHPVTMEVAIGGEAQDKKMVHVGEFARAIGRSVPTIHQWERNGLLPRTPFSLSSSSKDERLYTEEMIEVVVRVLGTRGSRVATADSMFRREIIEGWEAVGVVVEKS